MKRRRIRILDREFKKFRISKNIKTLTEKFGKNEVDQKIHKIIRSSDDYVIFSAPYLLISRLEFHVLLFEVTKEGGAK